MNGSTKRTNGKYAIGDKRKNKLIMSKKIYI